MIINIEDEKANLNATTWPKPRRIIHSDASIADQSTQLKNWVEHIFTPFLTKHGPLQTINHTQLLQENEFMHLYDIIESQVRFKL